MRSERFRGPRQFRYVFVATMALLSATLVWLGVQLLAQDAQIENARRAERREAAADMAVAAIEKHLSAIDQDLGRVLNEAQTSAVRPPADGAVMVRFRDGGRRAWPAGCLLYYPDLVEPAVGPTSFFDRADALERQHDFVGAIKELSRPAPRISPEMRALTIVRIARNNLKNDQPEQAIRAYEQLNALGETPVGGMPVRLAGELGILAVYERRHDRTGIQRIAQQLDGELQSGRILISRETYEFLSSRAAAALNNPPPSPNARAGLSEAVDFVWRERRAGRLDTAGRRSVETGSGPMLVVWRSMGAAMAVFTANPTYIAVHWLPPAGAPVALIDVDGRPVVGRLDSAAATVRPAQVTALPWTIGLANVNDRDADLASARRHQLLIAGLAVMLGVIVTGAWFVGRSVSRELQAAHLQSDFVAAVSHEFRTPLTTLCQLSELLKRGRVASDADRQTYYEFLHRESDRLRRLVEGVLDLGRLQTGKAEFRVERLDATEFIREASEAFAESHPGMTHRLVVDTPPAGVTILADPEAMRCAVWNLLENAVKYSPDRDVVHIQLRETRKFVEIAVRDEGMGIPRHEQRRIFDRFTRGAAAREQHIAGTGIGLATAREVVRAHGGDIRVHSEPGRGSTFTIRLPAGDDSTARVPSPRGAEHSARHTAHELTERSGE